MACPPPGSSYGNAPHGGGDNTVAGPEPQEACVLGSGIHKRVELGRLRTNQNEAGGEALSGSAMCT